MLAWKFDCGGAFSATIFGWQHRWYWEGGDGVTLQTWLDEGATGGARSPAAAAACSSSSTA